MKRRPRRRRILPRRSSKEYIMRARARATRTVRFAKPYNFTKYSDGSLVHWGEKDRFLYDRLRQGRREVDKKDKWVYTLCNNINYSRYTYGKIGRGFNLVPKDTKVTCRFCRRAYNEAKNN